MASFTCPSRMTVQGFNVKDGADRQGLGLWSMRERARLVDGRFEIHSEKEKGTRIDVWTLIELKSGEIRREPADDACRCVCRLCESRRRLNWWVCGCSHL